MIADKSINLDTLHKVLFDNEKLELSEECIRKVEESFDFLQSFSAIRLFMVSIRGSAQWHNTE